MKGSAAGTSIFSLFLLFVSPASAQEQTTGNTYLKGVPADGVARRIEQKKKTPLCVVGCTPYVNPTDPSSGILKWEALVTEMAKECQIMVHVGDTKAGGAPCNRTIMTGPLKTMAAAGKKHGSMVLYAVGDNEMVDCHRDGSRVPPKPADFYKAADARAYLISDLKLGNGYDLSGKFKVQKHSLAGNVPGTSTPYSCDFDTYAETATYAVATLEVPGSFWYLADQTAKTYVNQDTVDPLAGRLPMYLNAKDCALDWITQSALKASQKGLKAVFFTLQAHFWNYEAEGAVVGPYPGAVNGIGAYYNSSNLPVKTAPYGTPISEPFQPLYDRLTAIAKLYPQIIFYVVNADNHLWTNVRMNSNVNNEGSTTLSHHNLMIQQVEGDSRSLTMYAKFTIDKDKFMPVDVEQIWSKKAYDITPVGHNYYKYG